MKRALLLLALLFCIVLSALPTQAMEYEPDGFRDIRWGTPPPKNNIFGKNKLGLVFNRSVSSSFESTLVYNRKNENLTLGGATLTEIRYTFMEELGFCKVTLFFRGDENLELIRKACTESWGKPTEEEFDEDYMRTKIFWIGDKVFVSILYSHNYSIKIQGSLTICLMAYFDATEKANARYEQRERGL